MIDKATTFILGAGASVPYGYPTGFELRNDIIDKFPSRYKRLLSDGRVDEIEAEDMVNRASEMVEKFRDSTNPSIDLWLSRNPEYADLGKIAIALSILECEKQGKINTAIMAGSQDWFSTLFAKMTEVLRAPGDAESFSENAVVFVTFSYDRSLEHLLYQALTNSFNTVRPAEIGKMLGKLMICHVYGQVDSLPWQGGSRPYGSDCTYYGTQKTVEGIKIIGERTDADLQDAKSRIHGSERVFFLGFSYAPENLSTLEFTTFLNGVSHVYGTALDYVKEQIAGIKGRLNVPRGTTPNSWIENCDCRTLLLKYL